jgi:hypothetical protein
MLTSGGAASAVSAAGSGLDMTSILSSVGGGGVGGAVVIAIIGLIKSQMAKSASLSNCAPSIQVVAIIFAMIHQGRWFTTEGARFGVLFGIFVVCAFVLHNYVNLNIGLKLALMQAVAYSVQWAIIGIVIGLIYKPLVTP